MGNIIYNVNDRPPFFKVILSAVQQLLAILAATIAVPAMVGNGMSPSAALLGAGLGTIVYLLITKFKSPVFLGSSFAFIKSMEFAFTGALAIGLTENAGYVGLIFGALFAGMVYVILSLIIRFVGSGWIKKIMPAIIIGPIVAVIGLSLAAGAVGDLFTGNYTGEGTTVLTNPYIAMICGLVALFTTIITSIFRRKIFELIPFIIGIIAGYFTALIFTTIGQLTGNPSLMLFDFAIFARNSWIPDFAFVKAFKGLSEFASAGEFFRFIGMIAVAYVPVAFVVFAEHIADHENLSQIIGADLLENPGLHRTLMGDGVGSIAGAFFGGCPNTTYGESIGCVAVSGNASTITIFAAAIMAIVISFISPFVNLLSSIPKCVMGGICIVLYGYISSSGLRMIGKVDLEDNRNIFVISVILITGVGGIAMQFGSFKLTSVAISLILGIITNQICNINRKVLKKREEKNKNSDEQEEINNENEKA